MKLKLIIAIAFGILLAGGYIYWRHIQFERRKAAQPAKMVAVPAPVKKKAILPEIIKKTPHPKVAIVMDDFGYNMNDIDELFAIKEPLTISVLPNLPYSSRMAERARSEGYEVILHLPLESHRKDVREELDTVRSGMSKADVLVRLDREIASVPGLRGVSNHMGSKSTEDAALMRMIMERLKGEDLYFFDSLTSQKSVCKKVASTVGLRYASRDIFLDNSNNEEDIKRQILELRRLAFKRGSLIGICHYRKTTIKVLARMMPALKADGVRFVFLSELVN